jgi:hypothetical protein
MEAWNEIFEPILIGMDVKSPLKYEAPSLEDVINTHTSELIRKAENAKIKMDNEPDLNVSHCETCRGNFEKDKNGNVTHIPSDKNASDTTPVHGAMPDRKTVKKNE